jgi:two-component system, chemotaxis family, sensor histidine kinase and response regulator WspE
VNPPNLDDLGSLPMLELFRVEAENQTAILTSGLLAIEREPSAPPPWDMLMRAAHSLKGAARIVNLEGAVRVAHALEDCFAAAQQGLLRLRQCETDLLLCGVDMLLHFGKHTEATAAEWEHEHREEIQQLTDALTNLLPATASETPAGSPPLAVVETAFPVAPVRSDPLPPPALAAIGQAPTPETGSLAISARRHEAPERVVRLTAENLNRLLGLAGESLVESRWLRPFADSLQRLKRHQADLSHKLEELRSQLNNENLTERADEQLNQLFHKVVDCQQFLADRMQELDMFDRRSAHLSQRLYLEALRTRMRPFADGTRRFPRMVRDLARSLGKEVRLEIVGQNTQVDRDILERLETPLAHLLRNAVDHGCETREQRQRVGKPAEGTIRLEARHSAGMLLVTVTDDGAGVILERVRDAIIEKKLAMPGVAEKLSEAELLDFLFLPGFTLAKTVTEISGRGVGLDVVQNMVRSVRGTIRVNTQPGRGLRVQLQLPLTLSVLRALLVEVADEPYAIPLTQIVRALKLSRDRIESLEGRHHFQFRGQQIGLLAAHQVLECRPSRSAEGDLSVVVLGDRNGCYGLVVDRFLGQRELVVQPLDPRLGKVHNISAAALMEDGSPILIIDADDVIRSIDTLVSGGLLARVHHEAIELVARRCKRVLVVDDSITVRELQRKLLSGRGYLTDVAVDGLDAWNALRAGQYDLVIADVDMPRMDGIELATLIKRDPQLKSLPVMIVSYKDSEADRLRGLEAGADYYLTKGSFQDETFLQAVVDLIGGPDT